MAGLKKAAWCSIIFLLGGCASFFKTDYELNSSYFPAYDPYVPPLLTIPIPSDVKFDRMYWASDSELLLVKEGYAKPVKQNKQWDTIIFKDTVWRVDMAASSVIQLNDEESKTQKERVYSLFKTDTVIEKDERGTVAKVASVAGKVLLGFLSAGKSLTHDYQNMVATIARPDGMLQKRLEYQTHSWEDKNGSYRFETTVWFPKANGDTAKKVFTGNPFYSICFLSPESKYLLFPGILYNINDAKGLQIWNASTIPYFSPSPDFRRMAFVIEAKGTKRIDIVPFNVYLR